MRVFASARAGPVGRTPRVWGPCCEGGNAPPATGSQAITALNPAPPAGGAKRPGGRYQEGVPQAGA